MSFFDHVYLINLDRRPDRWIAAQSQLDQLGIHDRTERISALDTNCWKGCAHSHAMCLDRAIANTNQTTLIIEDDFILTDRWQHSLSEAMLQLPSDWDMLYLGYNFDPATPQLYIPKIIGRNLLQFTGVLTTHMYALNGVHTDTLVKMKSLVDRMSDVPIDIRYLTLISDYGVKAYGVYPMVAEQRSGFSDIVHGGVQYSMSRNVDRSLHANGLDKILLLTSG